MLCIVENFVFKIVSLFVENNVPLLLEALCSNDMTAKEHLEKQQALVKQLAEILDFVLKFDDLKVCWG